MPNFTSSHRSKMSDPTRITKNQVERGQIAKIAYKKADGTRGDYLIEKNISSIILYNYDYGVFDKIPSKAEQARTEAVRRDDNAADSLSTG